MNTMQVEPKKTASCKYQTYLTRPLATKKEHAKIWFKLLHDGVLETTENLKDGIKGELYEYNTMYTDFAKIAYEEGYDEIRDLFTQVGAIEQHHAERYAKLLKNIEEDTVFKKNTLTPPTWECGNCGHIHRGEEAQMFVLFVTPKSLF